jgi:hypothetical protein
MDLHLGPQLDLFHGCMRLTALTYTRVYEQPMFEEHVKTDQDADNLIEIVKNLNIFDS